MSNRTTKNAELSPIAKNTGKWWKALNVHEQQELTSFYVECAHRIFSADQLVRMMCGALEDQPKAVAEAVLSPLINGRLSTQKIEAFVELVKELHPNGKNLGGAIFQSHQEVQRYVVDYEWNHRHSHRHVVVGGAFDGECLAELTRAGFAVAHHRGLWVASSPITGFLTADGTRRHLQALVMGDEYMKRNGLA